MDRILPNTVLLLVEESFAQHGDDEVAVHAGSINRRSNPTSHKETAAGRYVYMGDAAPGVHVLRFKYDNGDADEAFFVETAELSRAFTLSADYYATACKRIAALTQ